jgi:hypothetical protein
VPTTTFGKEISSHNSLKHGLTAGATLTTPAQARSLPAYLALWLPLFGHLTHPDARRLLRDLALADLRIDQCQDADLAAQSLQSNPTLAAEDAALQAIHTFEQLDRHPERTIARLRQSSAGCHRLIRAWTALQFHLDATRNAPEARGDASSPLCKRLLNLLGRDPHEVHTDLDTLRALHAWTHLEATDDLTHLIARQIAELETLAQQIHDTEEAPLAALIAQGFDVSPTPDRLRLRRYEAANRRLYNRCKTALEALTAAEPRPESEPTLPTPLPPGEVGRRPGEGLTPAPTVPPATPTPTSFGALLREADTSRDPLADLSRHAIAISPNPTRKPLTRTR